MHRMGYEARARIWNYLILIQLNLKGKVLTYLSTKLWNSSPSQVCK